MKKIENCLSLYMMENIGTGRRVLAYSTADIAEVLGKIGRASCRERV